MNIFYMSFDISFLCCLVITLITSVSHISMNRVYMCFEISFPCRLVITLITRVLLISVNRFYVSFETSFMCCFVITLITWVSLEKLKKSIFFSFIRVHPKKRGPWDTTSRAAGAPKIFLGVPVGSHNGKNLPATWNSKKAVFLNRLIYIYVYLCIHYMITA